MADEEPLIGSNNSRLADPNDDNASSRNVPISHPDHILHRLLALLLMCLIGFGSYFCYDNPSALQDNFKKDMNLSTSEFVQMYSWYAWPNVICCSIGGFLLDRIFGIRFGTIVYVTFVVIGQLIFACGAYMNSLLIVIIGRFIFGIGGESLAVAQNSYAVLWFKGKELNMVFGFQMSMGRVGSTVNFVLMEPLYQYMTRYYRGYHCLGIVLFIACSACFLSLLSALLLAWQDSHAERVLTRRADRGTTPTVSISDVKTFPASMWIVTVIIIIYYSTIFPFIALGKVFFMTKFGLDPLTANLVNSILYLVSALFSPIMGLMIDRVGRNVFWVMLGITFTGVSHSILAFTSLDPFVGMVMMGMSYAVLASALWPLIALVIPEHLLGTAYGISQSFQNLGLAIASIIAGLIVDHYGYTILEIFFLSCLLACMILSATLLVYDSSHENILNMSAELRSLHDKNTRGANIERDTSPESRDTDSTVPANDQYSPVNF